MSDGTPWTMSWIMMVFTLLSLVMVIKRKAR